MQALPETANIPLSAGNSSAVTGRWYVLTTNNPGKAKGYLDQWNVDVEDGANNGSSIGSFIPYTFIDSQIYEQERMQDRLSLRSALYRYLFVQGETDDIERLIRVVNQTTADRMFFLRNGAHDYSTINQAEMDQLTEVCSDGKITLQLPVKSEDLVAGKEIPLIGTPFEKSGATYTIVDVKKKSGAFQLQIALHLFNITFQNLFVTVPDLSKSSPFAEIVGNTQAKLIEIFIRRVKSKQTRADRQSDDHTLEELFEHRTLLMPSGAMQRHFLALMLICAQLLHKDQEKAQLKQQVEKELAAIAKLRESKAATDTRAYLHIAMYIATKHAAYREQAKAYVRDHNPRSPYLRKLVATSSQRQALKLMG